MKQEPLMLNQERHKQQGQTLVETMVASLVLVIGIGAAVSLAIYGLQATTSVSKQLIGVGLAREGIEAVKNMRDTNWLRDPIESNCYNFYTGSSDASCYAQWLTGTYNIDPGSNLPTTYALGFDASDADQHEYWRLIPTTSRYGLNYTPGTPTIGFYSTSSSGTPVTSATSDFARKITLTKENFAPFDQNTGPRLKVTVDVWWKDRRCTTLGVTPPSNQSCKVTLETYLTNWKDY